MQHKTYIRTAENAQTAVLLVHGIVGTPTHFRDLLPLIPEGWSVYNILLDGHGGKVEDFSHTSMEKWKAQVEKQLDEILLTHRRVLIIAHSMGTLFAIRQAVRCREKICGLFLLNVPLAPFLRPTTAVNSLFLALGKPRSTPSAQAMRAATSVTLTPKLWKYLGWIPRFLELFSEVSSVKTLLPQLKTPALTFQSRHDELVLMGACKFLEGHPYITNTVLEHSGHFAYSKEDMKLLHTALAQMIDRVRQTGIRQ